MKTTLYLIAILLVASWTAILFMYKNFMEVRMFTKTMMKFTNRVRNKDFKARMDIPKSRYTNRLAKNLNRMAKMIDRYFNEVQSKNDQLDAIIKSVTNGILVVDINKKIYLANKEAKLLLGCDSQAIVEGEYVIDVIRDWGLKDFLVYNIGINYSITKELKVEGNRIYRVKIDPVRMQDIDNLSISTVVNIEDVTEMRKLENVRRDFAANVSHELKTPLTSIQGFVETLKSKDEDISPEVRKRFLDIIENESRRLTILINDILLISSIEGQVELTKEEFSIREVSEYVGDLLNEKAERYSVSVNFDYSNIDDLIYTQKEYFKDLLINLVTNGIKYNQKGGKVEIKYRQDATRLVLEIEDNGIGIDKDDLDRIFERFYRVSRSRSRNIEGTGLGLAIVKHIVRSLDAKIFVESELGLGTKFTIEFDLVKIRKRQEEE
ncbi:MAG: ATP-binding protein [Peptostreptococcus anaerobius]|uniref:sensor histidine kinase n=1 Tax=Peptostreptococcus anaerobius TaxID=1261 RepID=UPI00290262A2|nr:ATP-binding protein [Peptostreptococcus anaerobius]MDU0964505.1 ATP-binding protein [Peptostreptococcus anaerobius]MDU0998377.1 ATP-binding protein [Peptostreptococcus anaerobius]